MNKDSNRLLLIEELYISRDAQERTGMISISIPLSAHKKIMNLCWLIRKDKRPKISIVVNNILEQFIEDYKDQILELQSKKEDLF